MSPSPPFLVIREGISFWVENRPVNDLSATLYAFNEGCYVDAFCYDSDSQYWPIEKAQFTVTPLLKYRFFPWQQLPVKLTLGKSTIAEVSEITAQLVEILQSDSEFNDYSSELPKSIKRLRTARSASELIRAASLIK